TPTTASCGPGPGAWQPSSRSSPGRWSPRCAGMGHWRWTSTTPCSTRAGPRWRGRETSGTRSAPQVGRWSTPWGSTSWWPRFGSPLPGEASRSGCRSTCACTARAAAATAKEWTTVTLTLRGKQAERLLLSRRVLWYGLLPEHLVLLVIVRDPAGVQPDDFLFSTDLDCAPELVAEHYAGRWSIEDTFRNVTHHLAGQQPQ